ncbi:TIGR03986 family CRISPR-associated RAMP protein [Fusibacter sp. 3D3]|uniref:TIGR03986 family type III CRISPR-associated RAMP protein n=1 Tax=Fusibacter sp. 3D3 TaxID=1048380 RepID=UPI00085367AB|nr:TIGR03986 family CRISPR-associated RAMP protein [Fusibacter sp. 3D3]GAU79967.1 DUF324 domain-containing protein [Fusibacter sp. 3D3]
MMSKMGNLFDQDMLKKLGLDQNSIKAVSKEEIDATVKSPYNFVRFDEKLGAVAAYLDQLPAHNSMGNGIFQNGYVALELTTTAPLIILDNNKEMMKNHQGQYIIPGSSFRGLIRQNCQILSLSHISDDIEGNRKLTYRDLATRSSLNGDYKRILGIKLDGKVSVATHVKAGYLLHDERGYRIQPAIEQNGKTFYPIHEAQLRALSNNNRNIQFMYKPGKKMSEFHDFKSFNTYYKEYFYKNFNKNNDYQAYFKMNISFSLNGNSVKDIDFNKGDSALLCSGFMQRKARHTLVNAADHNQEAIEISRDDILSYEGFLKMNKIDKAYYELPEKGKIKPCFYIQYNGKLYFGFTQYLRLFYDQPIKAGIPNLGMIKEGYDYVESIFGFSNSARESGYRSRVSFCDLTSEHVEESKKEISVVMGTPKPTFYKYYLHQNEAKGTTYNHHNYRLRGYKQYWLKSDQDLCPTVKNDNLLTRFKPIEKNAQFKGRIYFNQLTQEEIGLLLWAIKVEPNCEYNIGFAKAYGYGSFKVSSLTLHIEDDELKYKACRLSDYTRNYSESEQAMFTNAYKKDLEKKTNRKIENILSIQEFIGMKTYKVKLNEKQRFVYLSLEEHKNAKKLPVIEEYQDKYTTKIKE